MGQNHHGILIASLVAMLMLSGCLYDRGFRPSTLRCFGATLPWPVGDMVGERYSHTATLLPSGKVLVVGGYQDAELYDPVTTRWTASSATAMHMPDRTRHTATSLPNGKVLVVGGISSSFEIYDPVAMTWTHYDPPGKRPLPRKGHTATLMPDGKVLVFGGERPGAGPVPQMEEEVEEYDFITNSWRRFILHGPKRADHSATLLPDGRLILAGGVKTEAYPPHPPDLVATASIDVFDPATGEASSGSIMSVPRRSHVAIWVPGGGPLGQVLIVGGQLPPVTPTVEVFDPVSNTWSTANSPRNWSYHTATLLPNRRVLVVSDGVAQQFDPTSQVWNPPKQTLVNRQRHSATLLENGSVLLAGTAGPTQRQSAELFRSRLPGTGHIWQSTLR